MGDQTLRGTAISLRQCATTSCTAHDTQQATAGATDRGGINLPFLFCILSFAHACCQPLDWLEMC